MRMRSLIMVWLWLALSFSPGHAADAPVVGMVLDLKGSAQLIEGGNASALKLLAYLRPGMKIQLAPGSSTSLTLYASKSVYKFSGPTALEVEKDNIRVAQGGAAVVQIISEKLVLAAQASREMPGAYRLRDLPPRLGLLQPQDRSVLLGNPPEFCWSGPKGTRFTFELLDDQMRTVARSETEDSCLKLQGDVLLPHGLGYRWRVSTQAGPEQATLSAERTFSVASQAQAQQVAALKPREDESMEEWILYATLLQSQNMLDDAKAAWRLIAARRPDLQQVRELAN